jgi:hypothetical protein
MSSQTGTKRFYSTHAKQSKTLALLGLFWIATFLYGITLRDRTLGVTLMGISLIYPVIILLSYLQSLKSINYADVTEEGMTTTNMGLFHREIRWAEIESMAIVTINRVQVIGVNFQPGLNRHGFAASMSMRISGYEALLKQSTAADGQTFIEWATEHLMQPTSKDSKTTKLQAFKVEPVHIKQSFKVSDFWRKPYASAWIGASLFCNILAGILKQKSHMLSSVFEIAGIISIGMLGASLTRFRQIPHNKRDDKKPRKLKG